MRHDDPATGDVRRPLRQYRGDVFVRKAVKSVAANALVVKRIGQGKRLFDLGGGSVKSRVETRYLRQVGIELQRHLDRREIVRLVQRRQRHQRFQLGQQLGRDA